MLIVPGHWRADAMRAIFPYGRITAPFGGTFDCEADVRQMCPGPHLLHASHVASWDLAGAASWAGGIPYTWTIP